MDGVADTSGVLVVAATATPSAVDGALLRQGRLETLMGLEVPAEADIKRFATELVASFAVAAAAPSHCLKDDGTPRANGDGRTTVSPAQIVNSVAAVCAGFPASYVERYFVLLVETRLRRLHDHDEEGREVEGLELPTRHELEAVESQMRVQNSAPTAR
jgi:SpoVK/Ycf46/Vps4 family AAA+-type ATPase